MKKTAKVFLCFVMAIMLSLTALPVSASACAPNVDANSHVSPKAAVLYTMVDAANVSIATAVRIAQRTPYDDVDALLITVDCIVGQVRAYASSIGAEIACEYTEYYIDGRTVLIDPIRVVNIPGSGGGSSNGGK